MTASPLETEKTGLIYSILDPTGNSTALVESEVPESEQPSVAGAIMRVHPEVEQVGFLRFASAHARKEADGTRTDLRLRMAGGEFCGNASLCAAVLHQIRAGEGREPRSLRLTVSGASRPVEVQTSLLEKDVWNACVRMPQALGIVRREWTHAGLCAPLSLVHMEGISHLIIEERSCFYSLKDDRPAAESAVRTWCKELGAQGLGLIFLGQESRSPVREYELLPLVYIPGSGTVFWENSCASGSAAAAMSLAAASGENVALCFRQPGGILRVTSDPEGCDTWLSGTVRPVALHHIMKYNKSVNEMAK